MAIMSRGLRLIDRKMRTQTGARKSGNLRPIFRCLRAMNVKFQRSLLVGLAGIAMLLMWVTPVYAQGCAMCYTTAAAAKAAAIRALRSGILVLLIPPVLMFIGIFVLAYSRRESFNEHAGDGGVGERELRDRLAWMPQAEQCRGEETTGNQSEGPRDFASRATELTPDDFFVSNEP